MMKMEEKISCPEGRIGIEGSMLRRAVSLMLLSVLPEISSTANPPGDESQQDKPAQKPVAERIDHYDINKAHANTYVPALRLQKDYTGSMLQRISPPAVVKEIPAAPTKFHYQKELIFDTEENRRLWVKSSEHIAAWDIAVSFVESYEWKGYDVAGTDHVTYSLHTSRSVTRASGRK